MAGFLEKLSEADKAKVASWGKSARNPKYDQDIPPEFFVAAKLGMFYGWEARVAFALGYIVGLDDDNKPIKIPYTFDMAVADVKAAEKVHYRRMIDDGDIKAAANIGANGEDFAKYIVEYSNKIRRETSER